jgi:hypothetical protein
MLLALRNIQDIPGWSAFEIDILKGETLYKNKVQVTETQFESLKSYGLNKGLDKEVVNSIVNDAAKRYRNGKFVSPNNVVRQLNEQVKNKVKNNKNTNTARVNEKRITDFINSLEPSIELRPALNKVKQNFLTKKYKNIENAKADIKKIINMKKE